MCAGGRDWLAVWCEGAETGLRRACDAVGIGRNAFIPALQACSGRRWCADLAERSRSGQKMAIPKKLVRNVGNGSPSAATRARSQPRGGGSAYNLRSDAASAIAVSRPSLASSVSQNLSHAGPPMNISFSRACHSSSSTTSKRIALLRIAGTNSAQSALHASSPQRSKTARLYSVSSAAFR